MIAKPMTNNINSSQDGGKGRGKSSVPRFTPELINLLIN